MIALIVLAALSSTSMTPEEEVEAWDPTAEARDPATAAERVDEAPNDNGSQAFDAAGYLVAGTGVGVGVGLAAGAFAGAVAAQGPAALFIGVGVFALCVFAGPTTMLLLFSDLPLWAPFAAGGAVVVGSVVGLVVGVGAGLVIAQSLSGGGTLGGPPALIGLFAVPVVTTIVGGLSAGIATTTIAAFSE